MRRNVIAEDIEESALSSGGPKQGRKSYSLSTKLDVLRKYDELGEDKSRESLKFAEFLGKAFKTGCVTKNILSRQGRNAK